MVLESSPAVEVSNQLVCSKSIKFKILILRVENRKDLCSLNRQFVWMELWHVGDHCNVKSLQNATAKVRFVGQTQFAQGEWIGVELDDILGKNDGSVNGIRYFSLSKNHDNYGLFCRENNLVKITNGLPIEKNLVSRDKQLFVIKLLEDKINSLKDEIQKLQVRLSAQKDQNQDQIDSLTETIEQLTLNNTELQDKWEKLNIDHSKFLKLNNTLSSENVSLKEELNMRNEMDKFIVSDNDMLDSKILSQRNKYLENVIIQLQRVIDDSLKQHAELINENNGLIDANAQLTIELNELKSELQFNKELILDLNNKIEAQENFEQIVQFLNEKNKSLTSELSQLRESLDLNNDNMNNLKSLQLKLAENENLLTEKEQEIDSLKDKLDHLKNMTLKEKDEKLINLNNKLTELTDKLSNNETYYHFGQYYINLSSESWDIITIQLKFLFILIDKNEKLPFLQKETLSIKLKLLKNVGCFLFENRNNKGDIYTNNLLQNFNEKFWNFKDWRFKLMENHLTDSDLKMNHILLFMNEETIINKNVTFWLNLFNDLLNDNIINILNHMKKIENNNIKHISLVYGQVLNINQIVLNMLNEANLIKKLEENPFLSVLTDLITLFPEVSLDNLSSVLDKLLVFLLDLNKDYSQITTEPETENDTPNFSDTLKNDDDTTALNSKLRLQRDLISELKLKLKISTQNDEKINKINDLNINLKQKLNKMNNDLTDKNKAIDDITQLNQQLLQDLKIEKFNKYQMGQIPHIFQNVKLSSEKSKEMDYISEINDLKKIIQHRNKHTIDDSNLSWLMNDYEESQLKNNDLNKHLVKNLNICIPLQTNRLINLIDDTMDLIENKKIDSNSNFEAKIKFQSQLQKKSNTITNVINEINNYI